MSRTLSPPICPTWNTECAMLFATICFRHVQFHALRETICRQSCSKILGEMKWKNLEGNREGTEGRREEGRYGGDSIYLVFFSSDLINGICGSCLRNHGASILDGRLDRGMKLSFK